LRVKIWTAHEAGPVASAPISAESTWEKGLMHQEAWQADWIGYETPEEDAARHALATWITSPDAGSAVAGAADAGGATERHFAFRQSVTLAKPVGHAALFATGQDTVSAWINGHQVLTAQPFPAWKQMPWKKFVRADATAAVVAGANTIAIETVHYIANPNGMAARSAPPTIATLYVVFNDGTTATYSTGQDWKTSVHAPQGWQQPGFDDSGWKAAVPFVPSTNPGDGSPGHPWIPDSVKELCHRFEVGGPIRSARLYATTLGAYELFLNGKRVGNDVLAPGWTDYRQHVKYQTYDVTVLLSPTWNEIGAMLAPGWYSTPLEWFQQPNNYGDTPPAVRMQLRIERADGSVRWVSTDTSWQASTSNILHSELYDGESQDARLIQQNWSKVGTSGGDWRYATVIEPKSVAIEAQDIPSIRVERMLEPKTMTEPKPGVYVYDFGQNFSGVEHIKV
jgi:alpha-L-rhamnosidase